jgi:hypothetical protein
MSGALVKAAASSSSSVQAATIWARMSSEPMKDLVAATLRSGLQASGSSHPQFPRAVIARH